MLIIKNLTKIYGDKKAVDHLSLHIKPGEIYGFIGHNGAGKTTTLKCITGILPYEKGEIFINGKSLKDDPIGCKKMLAYIPDNPDLYDYLSGIQYLNFVCDIYKIESKLRQERIKKYSDLLDLTDDLAMDIGSYSHGMKQKLSIIAAFVHDPDLIILDEPFVGLDPKATHLLKEMMKEFCKEGKAIFFSTHILEVAQKLCDRIAIIKNGKLVVSGLMEDITKDESLENIFLELVDNENTTEN